KGGKKDDAQDAQSKNSYRRSLLVAHAEPVLSEPSSSSGQRADRQETQPRPGRHRGRYLRTQGSRRKDISQASRLAGGVVKQIPILDRRLPNSREGRRNGRGRGRRA